MPLKVRPQGKRADGPKSVTKTKAKRAAKGSKRKREEEELVELEKRVMEFDLQATDFSQLPLTRQTASGLHKAHFTTLTTIQRKSIPLALQGHDVLGAAKTGSGKTLAFLIPVLELLYRRKWTPLDGLGALIVTPTRELATQIFEVLRVVGCEHAFSAGLVIGGKGLREEREGLHRMNIVVCTPGRMLQHLDQTVGLTTDNVQLLVLDEADRILDMGFRATVDAIIAGLPPGRQTLLFSATQTANVADLARLSLKNPQYVAVHEGAASATPEALEQYYTTVALPEKLSTLWSFLRAHLTAKVLVFMSSCKQVRYAYETFRRLHLGASLLHLHGKQKQSARALVAGRFSKATTAVLFATDVVARGVDFPAIDWVVQLDAPEDADTYIHRVGRTARFNRGGSAVLFLAPGEEALLERLRAKKVVVVKVNTKASKQHSVTDQLQALCFKDPELKYLAQKAFASYCRGVSVMKDKTVFKLAELPLEEFAASLGLQGAPRIRGGAADAEKAKGRKNAPRGLLVEGEKGEGRTRYEKMVERTNQTVLTAHYRGVYEGEGPAPEPDVEAGDKDGDEDFLTVKRTGYSSSSSSDSDTSKTSAHTSKRAAKLALSKKDLAKHGPRGQKLVFDDDGTAHAVYELQDETAFRAAGSAEAQRERFVKGEREKVVEADVEDRRVAREKRREKKRRREERERDAMAREQEEQDGGGGEEDEGQGGTRFLPYEPPPDLDVESDGDGEERGGKRQKRWFEEEKRKVVVVVPETLEDLEDVARGLLG